MSELWALVGESPAYRHVLLNHLPITGLAISLLVLLWGIVEDRWRSISFGLALCLVTSASALLVMQTGDAAYPQLFDELDGDGQAWLDHHAALADGWGRLVPANAGVCALALMIGFRRIAWRRRVAWVALATTLGALVAAGVVAEVGGRIRHPEFRTSNPPVQTGPGRIR